MTIITVRLKGLTVKGRRKSVNSKKTHHRPIETARLTKSQNGATQVVFQSSFINAKGTVTNRDAGKKKKNNKKARSRPQRDSKEETMLIPPICEYSLDARKVKQP